MRPCPAKAAETCAEVVGSKGQRVWDVKTGKRRITLPGHAGAVL